MDSLNVLWPCFWVLTVQICVSRAVYGLLAINDLAKFRRKLLIRGVATSPESVSANRGDGVIVEVGDTCRLTLMNQVSVPP
jgi:hypothetical protein